MHGGSKRNGWLDNMRVELRRVDNEVECQRRFQMAIEVILRRCLATTPTPKDTDKTTAV